jgi:spore maturation protein CgeB
LFEAIAGGALMMMDPMLTLPNGYVNGSNIVIYHSLDRWHKFILYYLEHPQEQLKMACKGWVLAMKSHWTYHWMEELFFGQRLTS